MSQDVELSQSQTNVVPKGVAGGKKKGKKTKRKSINRVGFFKIVFIDFCSDFDQIWSEFLRYFGKC